MTFHEPAEPTRPDADDAPPQVGTSHPQYLGVTAGSTKGSRRSSRSFLPGVPMSRLVRAVVRWWWVVLLAWSVLLAVLLAVAPPFEEVAVFDNQAFLPGDADSVRGGELLRDGWDDQLGNAAAVVFARTDGQLREADREHARELVAWLRSEEAPAAVQTVSTHLEDEQLASSLAAEDGRAFFVLAGFDASPFTPRSDEAVAGIREHLEQQPAPDGLEVRLTGSPAVGADQNAAIDRSVNQTHVISLGLVLVILLLIYRSPVAPIVPLVTIGFAFAVSLSVVSLLAEAGLAVSGLYETFAIVIVFGAGTDYCLFLISRYHEELSGAQDQGYAHSRPLRQATLRTTLIVLAAVLASSAATTFAGFSSQAVAEFGLFRTLGPAMALSVAITLVAALTIAPALMRLFGRYLFWPDRLAPVTHGEGHDDLLIHERTDLVDGPLEREQAP